MHYRGHYIFIGWFLNSEQNLQDQKQLDVGIIFFNVQTKIPHCRSYNKLFINNNFLTQKLRVTGSLYPAERILSNHFIYWFINFICKLFTWKTNTHKVEQIYEMQPANAPFIRTHGIQTFSLNLEAGEFFVLPPEKVYLPVPDWMEPKIMKIKLLFNLISA